MSLAADQSSPAADDLQLKELLLVVEQKQRFQALVLGLTDICWEVCMDKPSNRLESKTEHCMVNCVERFIDTTNFVTNRLKFAINDFIERKESQSQLD